MIAVKAAYKQILAIGKNFGDNGEGILTDNNGRTSNIVAVDVQANNGIIHAIDKVVLP